MSELKKKILYIHHGMGIGGAPLSLLFLLQKLDKKRYEPVVLCLYESEAADLYRKENIKTIVARGIWTVSNTTLVWDDLSTLRGIFGFGRLFIDIPLSIFMTYLWIKKISPDIVHLNSAGLIPSAIAAKLAKKKVVWHIREPLLSGHFGLRAYLSRICIDKFSDEIIAIGEYEANRLKKSTKINIIYNFIDFNKFSRSISGDAFRKEFNIQKNWKIVIMLGGVSPVKGTLHFIQALIFVRKKLPEVKFVIVGNYPITESINDKYYQEILETIKNGRLEDNVIFTGVRNDIPEILSASDVVVFPSIVPHSARPIIESEAMGKPVVASNLGGPMELVVHKETGLLVPPNDPQALAEAIESILSNPEKAQQMGEAGYRRARQLFDAEKNVKKTFDVYERLFSKPGS